MEDRRKRIRSVLGIVTFAIVLFVGLWHIGPVLRVVRTGLGMLSFFFIGLSVAFILSRPLHAIETRLFAPLNRRLGKRWARMRRPLAVLLTVLLLVAAVVLLVFMVIPQLWRTIGVLAKEIPAFMDTVGVWLARTMAEYGGAEAFVETLPDIDWAQAGEAALDLLRSGAGSLVTGTVSAATSVVSAVFNFVVGLILSIYVLLSKEKLAGQMRRLLYAYLPEARADRILYIGAKANAAFGSFLGGQLTEAMILGGLCFLGMSILGFQFATMVSVLVGVMSFIPIFGAFIGLIVGAFLILVHQGWMMAAWFVLFFLVLQQIEGNLIYPHVVGKSVMLPGLWVLTAVTLGGNIAGIAGMFLAVPACSLLYALMKEAVAERNAKRGTAEEKLRAGG